MARINRELREHSLSDGAWWQRIESSGCDPRRVSVGDAREFYLGLIGVDPRVHVAKQLRAALINTLFLDRLAFTLPEASLGVISWTAARAWTRARGEALDVLYEPGVPILLVGQVALFTLNQSPVSMDKIRKKMKKTPLAVLVTYIALTTFAIQLVINRGERDILTSDDLVNILTSIKIAPIALPCIGGAVAHKVITKVASLPQFENFGMSPNSFLGGFALGSLTFSSITGQRDLQAKILSGIIFGTLCWSTSLFTGHRLAQLTRRKIRVPIAMAAGRATFKVIGLIQTLTGWGPLRKLIRL